MKRVFLLSGTPMLARPVELFNLLKIMRPDVFSSFYEYTARYCNPREGQYGMDYTGNSNTKELHSLLEKRLMIRRLKKDCLAELPSKRRQKIQISTDPKIIKKIQ